MDGKLYKEMLLLLSYLLLHTDTKTYQHSLSHDARVLSLALDML